MAKPDWKDAPGKAKWLAQDKSGDWYWYKSKPEAMTRSWKGFVDWWFAGSGEVNDNFFETLEQRP